MSNPTRKTFDVQAGTNNSSNDRIQIRFDSLNVVDMETTWQETNGVGLAMGDQIVDYFDVWQDADNSASTFDIAGVPEWLGVASVEQARGAISALDFQLDYVNTARSKVGAVQNRLESAANNMETFTQNTLSAESQIRDADFAFETAEMSKFQVMQQAGVAILGQANGLSQGALRLI